MHVTVLHILNNVKMLFILLIDISVSVTILSHFNLMIGSFSTKS